MVLIGQLRELGITPSRREDNIKMVLKLLETDRVQESVHRLQDGMDSPGFEYWQTKKGYFSYRL